MNLIGLAEIRTLIRQRHKPEPGSSAVPRAQSRWLRAVAHSCGLPKGEDRKYCDAVCGGPVVCLAVLAADTGFVDEAKEKLKEAKAIL